METPTAAYIVCCEKIRPEDRDTAAAHLLGYREIDGGEDEGERAAPLGAKVYYEAHLTPGGVGAYREASNLVYLEPVREARPLGNLPDSGAPRGFAGDTESLAAEMVFGVNVEALRYVGLPGAWRDGFEGRGVVVYVGDTGVDGKHLPPSHKRRFLAWWDYFGGDGLDRDGHGSWVIGCAASPPGVRWVSAKVLNPTGPTSVIARFIRDAAKDAVARGVPGVVNLSLGFRGTSRALEDAARYALENGVLVVAAAGNSEGPVECPGNCPSVVAVSAIDRATGRIARFSCRGKEVDLAAPGVSEIGAGGAKSGTSMAAPFVAASAATVLSAFSGGSREPGATPRERRASLAAEALGAGAARRGNPPEHVGSGIVRARPSAELAAKGRVRGRARGRSRYRARALRRIYAHGYAHGATIRPTAKARLRRLARRLGLARAAAAP